MSFVNKKGVDFMLFLCFGDLILGKLEYIDKKFVYTSNVKDEKIFKQTYPLGVVYGLFDSNKKILDTLPIFIQKFLDCSTNEYFCKVANIKSNFDDFEKLVAMSKINFDKNDFYLKSAKEKNVGNK